MYTHNKMWLYIKTFILLSVKHLRRLLCSSSVITGIYYFSIAPVLSCTRLSNSQKCSGCSPLFLISMFIYYITLLLFIKGCSLDRKLNHWIYETFSHSDYVAMLYQYQMCMSVLRTWRSRPIRRWKERLFGVWVQSSCSACYQTLTPM